MPDDLGHAHLKSLAIGGFSQNTARRDGPLAKVLILVCRAAEAETSRLPQLSNLHLSSLDGGSGAFDSRERRMACGLADVARRLRRANITFSAGAQAWDPAWDDE